MIEEEKDVLVSKRKYWTKLMKYNLVGTVLFLIYVFVILSYELAERCEETSFSDGTAMCNSVLISYLLLSFFLLISWPLSLIMYGYQSFKIYKITKPQPVVISKSEGMTTAQIIAIKEAKKLLDKKIITNSEFDKIKNEYADEEVVTRLRGIAELRDSGILTEDEFQEQKSKILSETPSQSNDNLSFKDFKNISNASLGKAVVVGIVVGVIILILIISLFSSLGGSSGHAYVEYNAGWCWSGAFHNGGSIISISGCGDESFNCMDNGDFCTINAQKKDDNEYELCVRVGDKRACTTAGYGIAQV